MASSRLPIILSASTASVGLLLIILGSILGWVVIPNIIHDKVKDETRLKNNTEVYEKWLDLPIPIYQYIYFFSLKNVDEYYLEGANFSQIKPQFEEVGPFVFKEIRKKNNATAGPSDTIYYTQHTQYIFDPDLSAPGLLANSTVNILNIPYITVLTLQDIYPIVRPVARTVLDSLNAAGEKLFMRDVPVDEVLFTGYDLSKREKKIYANVEGIARQLGIPLPDEIKNGVFALFRGKNDTDEGIWQSYRGNDNSDYFNVIRMMNSTYTGGKFNLNDWWTQNTPCSQIRGTDGTMFPPFVKKDRKLEIFVPEICRSVYMTYDSKTEYEGIPGYRFKFPKSIWEKPGKNGEEGENSCFCVPVPKPLEGGCDYSGVWKLQSCKARVPMVVGMPHWLGADQELRDIGGAYGLDPVVDKHESYVDVEPNTGFQIGAEVQPYRTYPDMAPFNTIPHTYYPVLWLDKSAELDDKLVDELKDKLIKPLNMVNAGKWSVVGVGIGLFVIGAVAVGYLKFK